MATGDGKTPCMTKKTMRIFSDYHHKEASRTSSLFGKSLQRPIPEKAG
jgi:hypothetical protein